MADQFGDWLAGLPAPTVLAPTYQGSRGQPGYIRGVDPTVVGQNQVPAMWRAFAPYGKSLIDQGALAKMRGVTAGISGGRREFERGLLGAYRGAGVNSLYARGALAESRPQVGREIAAARGGIQAERSEETFNLMAAIQNALAQSYLSERDMALELNQASLGRKASREGAKSAMRNSLLGAGATALGGIFGGPIGAGIAGSLFGGGGPAGITGITSR